MKMSKSARQHHRPAQGDGDYGADIIRLWALSVDYHRGPPHRRGDPQGRRRPVPQAAQHVPLSARRARRVRARTSGSRVAAMPELERYVLALLAAARRASCAQAVDDFDFNTYTRALIDFCNEDLSAFYFDIRKDCLYCDAPTRPEAPRLPHRARHAVPRAGPLRRAGAGVHRRGSVGHALSRRRQRAPARMAGDRRRLAR